MSQLAWIIAANGVTFVLGFWLAERVTKAASSVMYASGIVSDRRIGLADRRLDQVDRRTPPNPI